MSLSVSEQRFKEEVLQSEIPVLVNFWAPWCGVCHLIHPQLTQFRREYGDRIKIIDVNADESLRLASTYRLATLPTLLLFDGDRIVERIEGFQRRDSLRSQLLRMVEQYAGDHSMALPS